MGIPFALIYIVLMYLSPAEIFPSLESLHLQVFIGGLAFVFAVASIPGSLHIVRVPQVTLLVGLTGAIAISRLPAGHPGASASALLDFSTTAIAFYLMLFNSASVRPLRIVSNAVIAIAVYLTIHGAIEYFTGSQESALVLYTRGIEPSGNLFLIKRLRAVGFLADPNDFAQFLLVSLALLGKNWRRGGIERLFGVVLPGAILLAGVTLTRSRGGLLGILCLILLVLSGKIGRAKAGVLAGLVGSVLMALNFTGGRAISLEGGVDRVDIWREGWGMFKSSPLIGVGYGWFTHYYNMTAHNSFVLCFAELGLFGYFFWIALIVFSFYQLNAIRRMEPKTQLEVEAVEFAGPLRLALCAFLVTGYFLSRTYTVTFYLLIGMSAALAAMVSVERGPAFLKPARGWFAAIAAVEVGSIMAIYLILKVRILSL